MQNLENNILSTLGYFDIFNYPLKKSELSYFLGQKCREQDFELAIKSLVDKELVFQLAEFYSLQNDSSLVTRRTKGNMKADGQLKIAHRVGRLLSRFPFVQGVGISGSLSKNFADDSSDIDLFIITSQGRLWIARTLLHVLKKTSFLFGRQHWFCMNYFIDEQHLEIREKNIFTATEIATVLPVSGASAFNKFHLLNSWAKTYLPNYSNSNGNAGEPGNGFLKIFFEKLLNNRLGDRIDNWLMKVTINRWQKKTRNRKMNTRGIVMSMDAGKHYAKPDPKYFQEKIVLLYENMKIQLADKNFTYRISQSGFLKEII